MIKQSKQRVHPGKYAKKTCSAGNTLWTCVTWRIKHCALSLWLAAWSLPPPLPIPPPAGKLSTWQPTAWDRRGFCCFHLRLQSTFFPTRRDGGSKRSGEPVGKAAVAREQVSKHRREALHSKQAGLLACSVAVTAALSSSCCWKRKAPTTWAPDMEVAKHPPI